MGEGPLHNVPPAGSSGQTGDGTLRAAQKMMVMDKADASSCPRHSAPQPFPDTGRAVWMLFVLTMLYAASSMNRLIIGLLIPMIKVDFVLSDLQVSWAQGLAFTLFFVVIGLPFGYAVDRHSRRLLILVGVVIWSVATLACGFATSYWQLILGLFLMGAGEACLSPAAYSLISDSFPPHRLSITMALYNLGGALGAAAAYAGGGRLLQLLPDGGAILPLIGHRAPWQMVFIVAAAPSIALAPLIFTAMDPVRRLGGYGGDSGFRDALTFMLSRKKFFFLFFVAVGTCNLCAIAFNAWLPTYINRSFGIEMSSIGYMAGFLVLFSVAGSLITGLAADWLYSRGHDDGHLKIFAAAIVVSCISLTCATIAPTIFSVLMFTAVGYFFVSSGGVGAAFHIVTPNQLRGQVSALFLLVTNLIANGIGPSVVGFTTDVIFRDEHKLGSSIALTVVFAGTLSLACYLLARRPMRVAIAEDRLAERLRGPTQLNM